jgi:hypothetical protein
VALLLTSSLKDGAFADTNNILGHAIQTWVEKDGMAARNWLENTPSLSFGAAVSGSRALLSEYGGEVASQLFKARKGTPAGQAMLWNLGSSWASQDPEQLIQALKEDPKLFEGSPPAGSIGAALQKRDPERARQWLAEECPKNEQQEAVNGILQAGEYAVSAAERGPRLSEFLADGFSASEWLVKHVSKQFAEEDPAGSAAWIETLPAKERAVALPEIAKSFVEYDPVGASEWLAKQAPSPERDQAIKALVEKIRPYDPEGAEAWQNTLSP